VSDVGKFFCQLLGHATLAYRCPQCTFDILCDLVGGRSLALVCALVGSVVLERLWAAFLPPVFYPRQLSLSHLDHRVPLDDAIFNLYRIHSTMHTNIAIAIAPYALILQYIRLLYRSPSPI
jgi:hypothetical protein